MTKDRPAQDIWEEAFHINSRLPMGCVKASPEMWTVWIRVAIGKALEARREGDLVWAIVWARQACYMGYHASRPDSDPEFDDLLGNYLFPLLEKAGQIPAGV